MSDMTCKHCRHWEQAERVRYIWNEARGESEEAGDARPGKCMRIMHADHDNWHEGETVEACDASGYWAWLQTSEDFGCVLFEKKEDDDA